MKRTPLRRKTPIKRRRTKPRRLVPADEMANWIERGMPMGTMTGAVFYPNPGSRSRTKYARRPRDMARMAWIKSQPCCMAQMEAWRLRREHPDGDRLLGLWDGPLTFAGCRGAIEAHHAGRRAKGQKAPDDTCIPMCRAHHRGDDIGITRYRGPFAGWPRGAVKAWELAMVDVYQRRYADYVAGAADAPY